MLHIPIAKPYLGDEEKRHVSEVIDSGWVSQGPKVAEFEERFAEYIGCRFAVATTSCTTALHAALAVSGIGPGDEVIVPSLSFIATANSVRYCGATPVFVDIDPGTCNIDVAKAGEAITKKTRAIMPVHQMGLPADLEPLMRIAEHNDITIIEDAACAIGSEYRGKKIGGNGNTACFSFHPRKIITTGEGGMITTDDSDTAARLRRFRHHGMSVSDIERHLANRIIIETYPEIGYNYRMTDMQAAMGIEQMKKLPFILESRKRLAAVYDDALGSIAHIRVPEVPPYANHNYQSYWIALLDSAPLERNVFMEKLHEKGIATRRGIMAIHTEASYRDYAGTPLPHTERITGSTVLLPLYPSLSTEEQAYIIDSIKRLMVK
ncbi:MAG: DegT/DnrJ/EryC1/StrS family aminotransferase [Nitrospirota bacterium]